MSRTKLHNPDSEVKRRNSETIQIGGKTYRARHKTPGMFEELIRFLNEPDEELVELSAQLRATKAKEDAGENVIDERVRLELELNRLETEASAEGIKRGYETVKKLLVCAEGDEEGQPPPDDWLAEHLDAIDVKPLVQSLLPGADKDPS